MSMEGYASDSRNPYGRVSQEIASEQENERRLEREAQHCLGVLYHPDAKRDGSDSACMVEVYHEERDTAGHYKVVVPSVDVEGLSDDEAMAVHPATLAEDVIAERDNGYTAVEVRAW
jgi:hypothetical protein